MFAEENKKDRHALRDGGAWRSKTDLWRVQKKEMSAMAASFGA